MSEALGNERDGRRGEAESLYRKILGLSPAHPGAANNLASMLKSRGALSEALDICASASAKNPGVPELLNTLGNILVSSGLPEEALDRYRAGFQINPHPYEMRSNYLLALNYPSGLTPEYIFAEHQRLAPPPEPVKASGRSSAPRGKRKLRIGYLSADFRRHSVAFFIEPVISLHDRSAFEVCCLSLSEGGDGITERFKTLCDRWEVLPSGQPDAAAETVAALGVDILVDLGGHTGRGVRILARRPSPVQMTYLGYPNTTGLRETDFRITDAVADPPGAENFHSERLIRLPRCFIAYSPPDDAPDITPPPLLKNKHVTFGSFNALPKITGGVIKLWADILKSLPGSRLALKNNSLGDAAVRNRIITAFGAEGVSPDRVDALPFDGSLKSHLGRYSGVDLALDTFPYNGTTTTCEALWMGVPVVTVAGDRHAARVGKTVLAAAGLASFAADSPAGCAALCRGLAGNPALLAGLRGSLRAAAAASPLCDTAGLTRCLEDAYMKAAAEKNIL
jgi:predicted O-linked N-acetylglucosamine transferase (SPINDLY family)